MNPELAKNLFNEGGFFIFLDVPPGTEFGIDMNSWTVGEKFKGVKMIPPGLHFIFYSASNSDGDIAPRMGFFHIFKRKEILVKKWNKLLEDVSDDVFSCDEMERFRQNLKEIDRFLGAYPFDRWKKWIALTSQITEPLLQRLQPSGSKIYSAPQMVPIENFQSGQKKGPLAPTPCSLREAEERLPKMKPIDGTEINFTRFPHCKFPPGATPGEITFHSIDSSYTLQQMLSDGRSPGELLGELQFSFICFLVGQVAEGLEQWKRLIQLFCTCDEALEQRSQLFCDFITTIYWQINEAPEEAVGTIPSSSTFLITVLQEFFSNVETRSSLELKLCTKTAKFKQYLMKKFKWDFSLDSEDMTPVVVSEEDAKLKN